MKESFVFNHAAQRVAAAALAAALGSVMATQAFSKGGTAKPPTKGAIAPYTVATPPDPTFSIDVTKPINLTQFDVTGIIEEVTTGPNSSDGGSIRVNGMMISVPSNLIVQFPANTMPWHDAVAVTSGDAWHPPHPPLDLAHNTPYGSIEAHIIGNVVGGEYRAALIYLSQQSLNSGTGVISSINPDGSMSVTDNAGNLAKLVINDPNGRFSKAQSPDDRFSVDDQNPTIHAASGYPMCVPYSDATGSNDSWCPKKNRPKPPCRNFGSAGVAPPASGDFPSNQPGEYCTAFVMRAYPQTMPPGFAPLTAEQQIGFGGADDPDVKQQVPFAIGDYITYSGTLIHDPANSGSDYISVHTIEANVSVFTMPATQPAYIAMADFGVGSADPTLVSTTGLPQETQDRIFLEAETTDVKTPVDIFMVDTNDTVGGTFAPLALPSSRWVTPYEMTGECNPATLPLPANCFGYTGGVTTQNAGPNPQRARLRATKAIAGLLSAPSRNIRVMIRSFCTLQLPPAGSTRPYDQDLLDNCVATAPKYANGLIAGQYQAPVFEYIFGEGVRPGAPPVPNDLWHLPFLARGEGALGPLSPTPW